MATENQSSTECVTSPDGSESNHISLTSSEDFVHANCCAAGAPLPFVSWEFCTANSTSCRALTNATQSTAELTLSGSDLPEGDSSVRCVAEYLDVTEVMRTIWLQFEQDGGKTH